MDSSTKAGARTVGLSLVHVASNPTPWAWLPGRRGVLRGSLLRKWACSTASHSARRLAADLSFEMDKWTIRYSYSSIVEFSDEAVYSGHLVAKAKRKYARFIRQEKHGFAFSVRVRGRYDSEVILKRSDEVQF